MSHPVVDKLLTTYPIVSDQMNKKELAALLEHLVVTLNRGVEGDIVELGCYCGTTSLFITRVLQDISPARQLHVYDSFEGLPSKQVQDTSTVGEQFIAGELAVSKQLLIRHFQHAGLRLPVIHKAWFNTLTKKDMPDRIAFAFLDGDFYSSIRDSLKVVWPQMAPGGIIVIDDYANEALPGAARAAQEFAKRLGLDIVHQHSLGILRVPPDSTKSAATRQ